MSYSQLYYFFLLLERTPRSTLFPYTMLFRSQLSGESLSQQIAESYAMHQAEPQNVDVARRLGSLSEQKDDLETAIAWYRRSEEHTSELQSRQYLVCRLLLEKKKTAYCIVTYK